MTEKEVAQAILNRRNSLSPVVMSGEMQGTLGQDGYRMALDRRWIIPSYESGELQVTNDFGVLTQLRQFAEAQEDVDIGDSVMVADSGKTYQAKVSQRNPDGTIKLTFGDDVREKPRVDTFTKDRIKLLQKASTSEPAKTSIPSPSKGYSSPVSPQLR
jgi:hypothetical protein